MKSKKAAAFIAAMISLTMLASCGGSDSSADKDDEKDKAPETTASVAADEPDEESAADTEEDSEEDSSAAETEASSEDGASSADESQAEPVKSDGYEKFSQIEIGMTESEVNAILGEPIEVNKADYSYIVTVNGHDAEVTVWISTVSGLVVYKNGDFYGEDYFPEFADSGTDFSAVGDLEDGVLNSYEDCTAAFKTPGYLTSINEDGVTSYLWVDSDYGHLSVTFKADGSVRSFSGYC